MKPVHSQKSFPRILFSLTALLIFASPVLASRTAPFTAEGVEGPWTSPEPYWKSILGAWELESVDGLTVLTSTAVNSESGSPSTSYAFLDLDRAEMYGTEFVIKFRIPEVVPPPEMVSAAFYISFTKDSPVGSAPNTIFSITGLPVTAPGDSAGTNFRFYLTGEAPEGEVKSQTDIASKISTEDWLALRIKVDSEQNTVVAGFEGWSESEPVVLRAPWSDVRFIRIFQRGMSVEVNPVENVE